MAYSVHIIHDIKAKDGITYQIQDTESNSRLTTLEGAANVPGSVAKAVSDSQTTLIGDSTNDTAASNTINGAKKYADSLATKYDATGSAATAKSEVIGGSSDTSSADTINGAKKYAKELVDKVLGSDSSAETITNLQNVLNELNNPDNAEGIAGTFVDTVKAGLAGLGNTDAVYYTEEEINGAQEGDPAYGKTTSDIKTPSRPITVKEYVDDKVSTSISGQTQSAVVNGVLNLGL
jgi:hypothetical protein